MMILRGLITWVISQYLVHSASAAKVVPLSDHPLSLKAAGGTGDFVCPLTPLTTAFVSIWLKPPGFLKFYQDGEGSFTVMNQEILYGTISSLTLATAKTLYQSENWLNVIFRVMDTTGGCKFDKFYIRKFANAEIDTTNTVSRELPNYMTYLELTTTKKLSLAPTEVINGTPSRLLVPSGAKILFSADPEMSLVTFMGNSYQGSSTIFSTDTFELHTGHSAEELEVYYKMIVLGRPKPMFQIPIFTQYFNVIPKLQKAPYDIDDYMSRVFDHGKVGYTIKLGTETVSFGPVEFNYDTFSNTIALEFQVQLLPLHNGVNGLQLNMTFSSTDLDSRRSEFSPIRVEVTKPDPALQIVQCSVYDQRNSNLLATAEVNYIALLVDANSVLSFEVFLGFGLVYGDSTTAIVERMIAVGATDGYNSGWAGHTMTYDEPFFLLRTSSKESLNMTLKADCLACGSADQLSFRFLKYQVLFGVFSPKYIADWKAPAVPTSTKFCGMVLDTFPDTSATALGSFKCSSLFLFITPTTMNYYSTGPDGSSTNAGGPANCLVPGSTSSCFVCDSTTMEEFSMGLGDAPTYCFTDISCPKLAVASNTYFRRVWTYPTTSRKVCHSVLSGCLTSIKPLLCDTCEPFKSFIEPNNNYSCQCAIPNCLTCENSPCETCTPELATIYINKTTSIFTCQGATECNTTAGVVLAPGILPLPTTPWCRDCLDSNCENCTMDSETCVNCLPSFYFDPLRTCQPCVSNCSLSSDL